MIKIGTLIKTPEGKSKKISYKHAIRDEEGWIDASRFLPEDFDMVEIKSDGLKQVFGWCMGKCWDGLYVKPKMKIKFWKKLD